MPCVVSHSSCSRLHTSAKKEPPGLIWNICIKFQLYYSLRPTDILSNGCGKLFIPPFRLKHFCNSFEHTHTRTLTQPSNAHSSIVRSPHRFCAILIYNNINVTNMQQNKITLCKITPNYYSFVKWICYSNNEKMRLRRLC